MKIAAQYSLSVVPLFLLLGLISCVLMLTSEQEEIRWGLHQEASSLVIGLSEFLCEAESGKWTSGVVPSVSASTRSALEQLLTFRQARAIRIVAGVNPSGPAVLTLGDATLSEPNPLNERERQSLLQGSVVVKDRLSPSSSRPLLTAYGALRDAERRMVGILAIDTGAEELVDYLHGLWSYFFFIMLGLLALGLGVSLFTSFIINREIRGLSQTAEAFAAGSYEADLQPGWIREIQIAGGTFRTLGSVLKAHQDRSRRELLQGEHLHSDEDLALAYAELCCPPPDQEIAGVEIAGKRFGRPVAGEFWGALEREGGGVAVLGKIAEGKDLDLAATAAAAAAFVLQSARSRDLPAVMQEAQTLFPLEICTVIGWTSGEVSWQCHQAGPSREIDSPLLALCSEELVLATTLPPAIAKGIVKYSQSFDFSSTKGILDELCLCLGNGEKGSLLLLRRRPIRTDHSGVYHAEPIKNPT